MPDPEVDITEWVAQVFDHPGAGPEWYFDRELRIEEPDPATCVRLLTALYRDPVPFLAPYSDAQLARGFWYLTSDSCSSYGLALLEPGVPLEERVRCVNAMRGLFADVFQPRCPPLLGHLDRDGNHPLNTICYMWWDVLPTYGQPQRDVDEAFLASMAAILELDSLACQESALHGLGHWQAAYPDRVVGIIDGFVKRTTSGELRQYAAAARTGCVL